MHLLEGNKNQITFFLWHLAWYREFLHLDVMLQGPLWECWGLDQHGEVFGDQVDPVDQGPRVDVLRHEVGGVARQFGLVDEEGGQAEPGHEGVEASSVPPGAQHPSACLHNRLFSDLTGLLFLHLRNFGSCFLFSCINLPFLPFLFLLKVLGLKQGFR